MSKSSREEQVRTSVESDLKSAIARDANLMILEGIQFQVDALEKVFTTAGLKFSEGSPNLVD